MVSKMLPLMLNSGEDCRLIFVSSEAHRTAFFDLEKAQGKHHTKENFKRWGYYANSKLYQVHVYDLLVMLSITKNDNTLLIYHICICYYRQILQN
jgi:hypothetical protein